MMETTAVTPARRSDSSEDVTQVVARLGGAAGADGSRAARTNDTMELRLTDSSSR
ncbi:hypothetical protein Scep_016462 [Stephania cephalantha]|uniref:Uncharacterized protein n=1 Tax=Stephania cephalantha TaxID=152367 RepID=A0AAP0IMP3_9MAGN